MIDARALKIEGLCFLRYGRSMPFVATEVETIYGTRADVFAANDTCSIELEVKTSRSDLKNEFKAKANKHARYRDGDARAPNWFWFLMPEALARDPQVQLIIETNAPYAGILYHLQPPRDEKLKDGQRIAILRPATKLHTRKPTSKMLRKIMLRMGSEICGLHILNKHLSDRFNDLRTEMVDLSAQYVDAVDIFESESST